MFGLFKKKSPADPKPKPTLAEVEAKYADQIRELVQVAATLEEADVPTRSRFGGGPVYFPPDTAWPHHKGKPLLLLIQIDLAEAVSAVPELLARFPASGMIQVFIDDEYEWCSTLWADEDEPIRVFLHPDQELRVASGPGIPSQGTGIRFTPQKTLPDSFFIDVLSGDEWDLIHPLYSGLGSQMGGWASPIQNDPAEDGRVLIFDINVEDHQPLYVTVDPGPLKQGLLEDIRCESQYD